MLLLGCAAGGAQLVEQGMENFKVLRLCFIVLQE